MTVSLLSLRRYQPVNNLPLDLHILWCLPFELVYLRGEIRLHRDHRQLVSQPVLLEALS